MAAATMNLMNAGLLQGSSNSRRRMTALRLSHLQPILPPLSSSGGARPCTAIVARQQMKSKITLSGPASVEFVSLGSSCGRALPLVCRAVGGAATETQVDESQVESGSSRQAKKMDAGMEPSDNNWKIKLLYDGGCPICMIEVNMLKERDNKYRAITFVDIDADDYSPDENNGIEFETAMGHIHAIRRDGTVLTGVAAFRALYEEVGLGWIYAITNHQPWATIADALYSFWAKYRLPITGRPPLAAVLEKRRQLREEPETCPDAERCRVDFD
ncbi:hypothetical protein CY35_01G164600 [Sphagnum magellanicum]|nr:hypothetical protein CY35_01G164600 [Sphagnum magellanicum]